MYGIEETQGGQNTTLLQVGDNIKDADIPFKFATITSAGGLSDGVEHPVLLTLTLDSSNGNGQNYIYMAFAAAPLVGSNNVPANAR